MTSQYLIGELSVRLQKLEDAAAPDRAAQVADLRHEVESCPPLSLASTMCRAIVVADGMCWHSLARGDVAAFARLAAASAELRQFAVCARLIAD